MDRLRVATLLVAVVLVLLVPYPATFSDVAERSPEYEHHVVPVGSEGYQDRIDAIGSESDGDEHGLRTIRYENLSAAGRTVFDRALETERGAHGAYEYTPPVCRPGVLACPHRSADDLVPELSYGVLGSPSDAAILVETDEGSYLLSTRAVYPGLGEYGTWPIVPLLFRSVVLVPAAVLLAGFALGDVFVVRTTATVTAFPAVAVPSVLDRVPTAAAVAAGLATAIGVAWVRPRFDRRFEIGALAVGCGLVLLALVPGYLAAYAGDSWVASPGFVSSSILLGAVLAWGSGPVLVLASRYGPLARPGAEDEMVRSARK